jgi:hypothetical protein
VFCKYNPGQAHTPARHLARRIALFYVSHGHTPGTPPPAADASDPREHELVTTLFDLGRQVTSVLEFDQYLPERSSPAGVLSSVNTILNQRQLEEYYCTLCYSIST